MGLFLAILSDSFHIFKIILVCNLFFCFNRKNKGIAYMLSLLITILTSIGIYISGGEWIKTLCYIVAVWIIMFLLYNESYLDIIISGIWILFIISMLDIMFTVLVQIIFNLFEVKYQNLLELCASVISLIFIYIIGVIYNNKYKRGIKAIGWKSLVAFAVLALVDTIAVMIMTSIVTDDLKGIYKISDSIAFIFTIIGIFVQLAAVILLFTSRNISVEKEKVTRKYLDEQKRHYEYLEHREKETKKFRHDLRSHMQMLSNLARNNEYKTFDDYMEAINVKIDNFGNVISTGNGIVDAVVNQYYSEALQNNVRMKVKGNFPNDCKIEAYDLCTIFSNILSNALEAAEKAEDKKISLNCRYTNENIIIVLKNSFKDVGQFDNGVLRTNKDDINYHGFGLENIRECVEKNDGMLDIEIAEGEFTLTILLKY